MRQYLRHRYALLVPFALLLVVTIVGGLVNGNTARGRLVDEFTGDGAKGGSITHGVRTVEADEQGNYAMSDVPRTSKLGVTAPGYLRTSAPGTGGDVRLSPLSLTVQVNQANTVPTKGIPTAQFRKDNLIVGTTNDSGNTVIAPHPGRDAKLLVCAKDYETLEVTVRGVTMTIDLRTQQGNDCPPLPTPSPSPVPSPSPGGSPSPAPTPSPSPRPS